MNIFSAVYFGAIGADPIEINESRVIAVTPGPGFIALDVVNQEESVMIATDLTPEQAREVAARLVAAAKKVETL